ncbi:patatin-like phospholipase family protein [Aquimarina intermedia]|uniref:NTE family protein n=1 Tax=Aquimarina intermedia TaxID=350814 RepID=A0A5S5CFC2_9FLAO|nr:patatin-like phospholipase family protein [Aquimarina intermedia]TYP77060.1 NTE family protein [Aquimarina intermedia]
MNQSTPLSKVLSVCILAMCYLGNFTCLAQTSTDTIANQKDIKVGIVLSGGGAKGLAHIGVLKVIEDSGVRIDYIGGTSMGAIIGSLYAAGYSATTLDSIFRSVDFNELIQDDLPRRAKTFYEREDAEKYAITLPFDKFKVGLPKSLSKGQNFYNLFSRYTSHVNNVRDFDSLPIPFFCVATNIENGEQVILDKGYLPQAVSASSALPSVFSPVEIDGVLLTDGGVANNYPVEEIKKRGADIVIGVDVQDSLMTVNQLNSVTNIMLQISNFRTIKDMRDKITKTDIYIKPSIGDFTVLSFQDTEKIIKVGEEAAQNSMQLFEEIRSQQQPRTNLTKTKQPISKTSDTIHINSLLVSGNTRYTRSYVKGKLKMKIPLTTTYQRLNEGINNLSATGNFDRVSHRLIDNETGKGLLVNVKESKNKMLLRLAVHYDDLYKTAALLNVTRKSLFLNNDVLSADLALGDNIRYNVDYYVDKGFYWSYGFKFRYNKFEKDIPYGFLTDITVVPNIGINNVDVEYKDYTAQVYAQTLLKQAFSLGFGIEYKNLNIFTETFGEDENLVPQTVFDDSDYIGAFSSLRFDSFDNKYFPSKGYLFSADLNGYFYSSDYNDNFNEFSIFKAKLGYAFPICHNVSVQTEAEAGTKIGNTDLDSFDFFLGGFGAKTINNFIPFYGYDFIGFTGQSFAKVGVTVDYEIFPKNHINLAANYANAGKKLFSTGKWFENPEFTGYALGYGLETFAGPVQVKYSYSPELGESEWFFSIGFWF